MVIKNESNVDAEVSLGKKDKYIMHPNDILEINVVGNMQLVVRHLTKSEQIKRKYNFMIDTYYILQLLNKDDVLRIMHRRQMSDNNDYSMFVLYKNNILVRDSKLLISNRKRLLFIRCIGLLFHNILDLILSVFMYGIFIPLLLLWIFCGGYTVFLALIVWCVIYKIIEKFADMLFGRFVKEKVSNNKQKFYRNFSLRTIMSEVYLRNLFCEN